MGADFLFAAAPKSAFGIEETKWRIGNMPLKDLLEIGQHRWGYTPDDENTASEIVEYVREGLFEAVEAIVGDDGRRTDYSILTIADTEVYVSGGLSWGDAPTDAYEFIELLSLSGITDDELWEARP